jgi:hypothetical protein
VRGREEGKKEGWMDGRKEGRQVNTTRTERNRTKMRK